MQSLTTLTPNYTNPNYFNLNYFAAEMLITGIASTFLTCAFAVTFLAFCLYRAAYRKVLGQRPGPIDSRFDDWLDVHSTNIAYFAFGVVSLVPLLISGGVFVGMAMSLFVGPIVVLHACGFFTCAVRDAPMVHGDDEIPPLELLRPSSELSSTDYGISAMYERMRDVPVGDDNFEHLNLESCSLLPVEVWIGNKKTNRSMVAAKVGCFTIAPFSMTNGAKITCVVDGMRYNPILVKRIDTRALYMDTGEAPFHSLSAMVRYGEHSVFIDCYVSNNSLFAPGLREVTRYSARMLVGETAIVFTSCDAPMSVVRHNIGTPVWCRQRVSVSDMGTVERPMIVGFISNVSGGVIGVDGVTPSMVGFVADAEEATPAPHYSPVNV